jgi:8-oxo-dGTP pyrophosphatase MutT (NUDIX family)
MPHIHTAPGQHDHTASAYLFRLDFDQPKVMLHFHRKRKAYMQFGGHIELNETPTQALVHELREESGYVISQVRILQPVTRLNAITDSVVHPLPVLYSTHPVGNEHFHSDIAYAAITNEAPKYSPEDGESTDLQLFTRQELIDLPNDKIIENVRETALFIFDSILDTWEPVPLDSFL